MLHGKKDVTKGGNPKGPAIDVYLNWVMIAWESLSSESIATSFKTCGINNELDGSEDELIHCFKPTGQVPSGFALLKEEREKANAYELQNLLAEIDWDQDEENGYLSDNSIIDLE